MWSHGSDSHLKEDVYITNGNKRRYFSADIAIIFAQLHCQMVGD